MRVHKLLLLTACMTFAFFTFQQAAQASVWNEQTILHVHNPIQIPGTVLTAGTYVVQLAVPNTNQNVIQFINRNDHHVVATVIAVPDQTYPVSGRTKLMFYEAADKNPPALRTWFYPGMEYGQEFVYPQSEAQYIANASNHYVPTMSDNDMRNLQQQANSSTATASVQNARIYRTASNGGNVSD